MLQMISLATKTTAVNQNFNLSLTFGSVVEKNSSKFTFQSKNKDLKATRPMKFDRTVVQKNLHFAKMTVETFQTFELTLSFKL